MTNPAEVSRLKALLTQATPTGAPIPELIQALAEYLSAWHKLAPEGAAKVMAEQAAEIERLQAIK